MTESITLAPMTRDDIPAVYAIERESFPTPWDISAYQREVENPASHYLVAWVGETIVGFGGAWVVGDEAHIVTLAVSPAYRRHGIGRRLLQGLLDLAGQYGVTTVTLEVRMSNHAAQALYTADGFHPVAIRPRYYPDNGEDALVMAKEMDRG
jgi:ribosomal-protein-alanine N-acetyltransferase